MATSPRSFPLDILPVLLQVIRVTVEIDLTSIALFLGVPLAGTLAPGPLGLDSGTASLVQAAPTNTLCVSEETGHDVLRRRQPSACTQLCCSRELPFRAHTVEVHDSGGMYEEVFDIILPLHWAPSLSEPELGH